MSLDRAMRSNASSATPSLPWNAMLVGILIYKPAVVEENLG
jgi:hypothetical protein